MLNIKMADIIQDNAVEITLEPRETSFDQKGVPIISKKENIFFKGMITPYKSQSQKNRYFHADEAAIIERIRIRTLKTEITLKEKDIIIFSNKRYEIESSTEYDHFSDFNSYIARVILWKI